MSTVCLHFKFGFCRFRETCRFIHNDDLCQDDQCDVFSCSKRHPKQCRYFKDFNRCKYGDYCSYKHEKEISKCESEISSLRSKVDKLESEVTILKAQNELTLKSVDKMIQEVLAKSTEIIFEKLSLQQVEKEKRLDSQLQIIEEQLLKVANRMKPSSTSTALSANMSPASSCTSLWSEGPPKLYDKTPNSKKKMSNHVKPMYPPNTGPM